MLIVCEGCGKEYQPQDMQVVETTVNLRDGTTREILFDGKLCCDFWDETKPGDWVELSSGEEVQLALWGCSICDGVYEHALVGELIDTDKYDPDKHYSPLDLEAMKVIVCSFCRRKEKDRFKPKDEVSTNSPGRELTGEMSRHIPK